MIFHRELSRRDFVKLSAGSTAALGLALIGFPNFEKIFAAAVDEVPVVWLQTGTCTGCSVSVLNNLSPKIQNVLVDQVVPGKHLSLRYHPTVMAAAGNLAMKALDDTTKNKGGYVLIVEGAISTRDDGVYCIIGEKDGHEVTALEAVTNAGSNAMAVIALGTCAAYGGIPALRPNPTGCQPVTQVFSDKGIQTPVINLPGCPPHPDWFVGTVASMLIGGLNSVKVDKVGRPTAFYGSLIHDNCPRRGHFDAGRFAKTLSEPYCMYELGCKGPVTYSDCPTRLWNSGTNWCIGANSPCFGCVQPEFPQELSPLYGKVSNVEFAGINSFADKVGIGAAAATGLGIVAHFTLTRLTGGLGAKQKSGQDESIAEEKEDAVLK